MQWKKEAPEQKDSEEWRKLTTTYSPPEMIKYPTDIMSTLQNTCMNFSI